MDKIFEYDVIRNGETAWIGTGNEEKKRTSSTLITVKNTMSKNSVLITKKPYIVRGGITGKDTVYSATIANGNKNAYLAVTSDPRLSDVSKYGGRTAISTMCYCLVEYRIKKKKVRSIEALPVFLGDINTVSDDVLYAYLRESITNENTGKDIEELKVLYKPIYFNSFVKVDGHYYYLAGRTGNSIYIENGQSLLLDTYHEFYLKKIDKAYSMSDFSECNKEGKRIISAEENIKLYDILIAKLSGPFKYKKTTILETLRDNREKFIDQTIEKQVEVLLNIVEWMNLKCIAVDLSVIGSGSKSGYCRMSKKITDCKEIFLINQSVTGLYETRVDLLKI